MLKVASEGEDESGGERGTKEHGTSEKRETERRIRVYVKP